MRSALVPTLKQQLPGWTALAQRWDPKNDQGFFEMFFVAGWYYRFEAATPSGLPALLGEVEDWNKKYGDFKDKEMGAVLWLTMARGKAELEDYQGAFTCLHEGLRLEPKNPLTRQALQLGPLALGLSTGTAFAISDAGHFLTNCHVAGGPGKVFLQLPEQQKLLPGRLVTQNEDLDLAVVKIEVPLEKGIVPLRIAKDHVPERGQQVGAWGYPLGTTLGHGLKLTKGGISSLPEAANRNMLMLDLKVNPGNSGSPLCDSRGNVIGIVSARSGFAPFPGAPVESYGLAVTSKDVAAFLQAAQVEFLSSEPAPTPLTWEEIDRRVSPAVAMVIKAQPMATVKELALKDGALTEESQLDNTDPRDPVRRQSFAKFYSVKLEAGKRYQIDMMSDDLDSYLRLGDATGKQLAQDDDSGDGRNARIVFHCPADGTYNISATTFGGGTGSFVLKVAEVSTASR